MEVYTLDPLYRRQTITDKFVSMIWTERYREEGDFQLDIHSTLEARNRFEVGTHLAINESHRVMTVETIEDKTDTEGRKILTVKGRSLERIMRDRVAYSALDDTTTVPKWIITDEPMDIARKVFHDICVTGILAPEDIIPYINEGTFLPASTIPEPVDPIKVELDPSTVYDVISDLATNWNFGFRILRHFDLSELYFDVYTGVDRTTKQSVVPAVVFTPELDNLQNISRLTSIADAKNVAYVFSPAGFLMVTSPDVDEDVAGFERRVLVVNATDITTDNPDVEAALTQRGREELAKSTTFSALDGEISAQSSYRYGTDYNLGDLVEQRDEDGATNDMRVTEQIFVSDEQGDRNYPTLALNIFINTGSWLSQKQKVWTDYGLTEYWEDQP